MAGETSKFLRRTEVAYYLDDGFARTQVRHPPCFVYRHRRLFKAADCSKCFRHRMKLGLGTPLTAALLRLDPMFGSVAE